MELTLAYISLSGNTDSFVTRLKNHLSLWYDVNCQLLNIKEEIRRTGEDNYLSELTTQTVVIVPTYLDGGNGIDSGTTEILTTPLRTFIAYKDNASKCLGVIGSGNKNFNNQYCLTAKQYANQFQFPLLGDFELRGTEQDVEQLAKVIAEHLNDKGG